MPWSLARIEAFLPSRRRKKKFAKQEPEDHGQVEQATAAPGEKRHIKVPRGK